MTRNVPVPSETAASLADTYARELVAELEGARDEPLTDEQRARLTEHLQEELRHVLEGTYLPERGERS